MSGWDSRKLACEQEAAALRAKKAMPLIETPVIRKGRFMFEWSLRQWTWKPYFHCTGCCYFWLWWGPLEFGIAR